MDEKSRRSSSLDRQIQTYPHPHYYKLSIGFAKNNLISKGEAVEVAIKYFFDSMPEAKRNELIRVYDNMSPEERKRPGSLKNSF